MPIDSSEEVATYSLPVGSGLVQENAAYNSLKTMMTYIMFIIFTALSYMMIPYTYTFLLQQVFNYTQTKMDVAHCRAANPQGRRTWQNRH